MKKRNRFAKDITIVKPIRLKGEGKPLPVKGKRLQEEPYMTTFMASKTKSGKTTVIAHLLKHCIDRRTKVYIFCNTVFLDKSWKVILNRLKRAKIYHEVYTEIVDENGVNQLEGIIHVLDEQAREKAVRKEESAKQESAPQSKIVPIVRFGDENKEEEEDPLDIEEKVDERIRKRAKTLVPKHLFIFDDLSSEELRSKQIVNLLKQVRHYLGRCWVSSQFIKSIDNNSWKQLAYLYLWKGLPIDDLKEVYSRIMASSGISQKEFLELYNDITKERFQFMNIDAINGTVRRGFNRMRI